MALWIQALNELAHYERERGWERKGRGVREREKEKDRAKEREREITVLNWIEKKEALKLILSLKKKILKTLK